MADSEAIRQRLLSLPVFARELIAGGVAGGLAKTCVAPLERTKILLQTTGTQSSVLGTLQGIVQREGLVGLFRGNGASVARIVPYAAIHFGSYEHFRRLFLEELAPRLQSNSSTSNSSNPVWDLLAGSASGAAAVILTYPLDLVRTRLAWASEQTRAPSGSSGARQQRHTIRTVLQRTVQEEGVAGLFRGAVPTLLGILPYAGLKFYVYQLLKGWYRTRNMPPQQQQLGGGSVGGNRVGLVPAVEAGASGSNMPPTADSSAGSSSSGGATSSTASNSSSGHKHDRGDRLPVPIMLTFGGVAGLLAQTVTYPLDVIRRQMQVQGLQQLHANEGPALGSSTPQQPHSSTAGAAVGTTTRGITTMSSTVSAGGASVLPPATGVVNSAVHSNQQLHTWSHAHSSARGKGSAVQTSCGHTSTSSSVGYTPRDLLPAATAEGGSRRSSKVWAGAASEAQQLQRLTMWGTTQQLVATGGWWSLFRGLSINYMKVVPSTAIGFTIYDALKSYLELTSNL